MDLTQAEQKRRLQTEGEQKRNRIRQEHDMDSLTDAELVEMLGEPDWDVMQTAEHTLLQRGGVTLDALMGGLCHPDSRVRAICALLMDHVGDDRCYAPLVRALQTDPREAVRRSALHALACQGCKKCPLTGDILAPILYAAQHDRSLAVRRRAVQYLVGQKRDKRAVLLAQTLLAQETDAILCQRAERVLQWHQETT